MTIIDTNESSHTQQKANVHVIETTFMNDDNKHDVNVAYCFDNNNEIVAEGNLSAAEYARLSRSGNIAENIYDWLV